jgi:hypothetical protein
MVRRGPQAAAPLGKIAHLKASPHSPGALQKQRYRAKGFKLLHLIPGGADSPWISKAHSLSRFNRWLEVTSSLTCGQPSKISVNTPTPSNRRPALSDTSKALLARK